MEKATFSESHAWNFSVQSPNWKTYADHCTACINIPSRLYETVISTVDLYGTVGKYGGKYSWKEPVKFSLNLSFFSLHSFFARWLGVSRSGVFVGEATTRLMQVQRWRRQQRGLVQRETEREWNRAKAKARERKKEFWKEQPPPPPPSTSCSSVGSICLHLSLVVVSRVEGGNMLKRHFWRTGKWVVTMKKKGTTTTRTWGIWKCITSRLVLSLPHFRKSEEDYRSKVFISVLSLSLTHKHWNMTSTGKRFALETLLLWLILTLPINVLTFYFWTTQSLNFEAETAGAATNDTTTTTTNNNNNNNSTTATGTATLDNRKRKQNFRSSYSHKLQEYLKPTKIR